MTAVAHTSLDNDRVLSGMRTTGQLHLGNYHGALKNWLDLQHQYDCYFFAADWHALTTHYEHVEGIATQTWEMILDWLAAGLDPECCRIFVQSGVPEHAELHLLLSMITPLSWLERVPTYKDQQEKLQQLDLATYGFLGYPLLQSADILLYKPAYVPVGEDQVVHVELTREIARRFNHLFGTGGQFQAQVEQAIKKMGKKPSKLFKSYVQAYQEKGGAEILEQGQALLQAQASLSATDQERLHGFLEGKGQTILPEPQVLLTKVAKFPGLDGQKMSKSYDNTIGLNEPLKAIQTKIKTMPTDPARVRRTDPGDPAKCPVWKFHEIYSDQEVQAWVKEGCTTAGIGCVECKAPLSDAIISELQPIQERRAEYAVNPTRVKEIIAAGTEDARRIAQATLGEVRQAMGLWVS